MKAFSHSVTGSTLKILAVITMFLDHIGACVFEHGLLRMEAIRADETLYLFLKNTDQILRLIGRVAFPIFCFLLVEGFLHTSNRKKYALRLFLFALISEIPFDLAIRGSFFDIQYQNVYFTLLIGLLVMMLCDYFQKSFPAQLAILAGGLLLALALHTDYGYKGVMLIELLYLFRCDRRKQIVAGGLSFCWELTAPLAFIPIWHYNGKRGLSLRWFFYWFYPIHLLLLWAFTTCLLPLLTAGIL